MCHPDCATSAASTATARGSSCSPRTASWRTASRTPRFEVAKTYEALVDGRPGDDALSRLRAGIELDDGPTHSAEAERLHRADGGWWVRLVLHEGRKRQVRRMLAAVGHPVRRLVRTRLGPLELGDLPPGVSRPLTHDELAELRALCGLDAPSVDAAEEAFL